MGLSGMRHCFNMGLSWMCHCFSKLSCPFHKYAYGFFFERDEIFKTLPFPLNFFWLLKNFIITYKSSWNSCSEILNRNSKRMNRYEQSKRRGALFWDNRYVKHMTMTTGKNLIVMTAMVSLHLRRHALQMPPVWAHSSPSQCRKIILSEG